MLATLLVANPHGAGAPKRIETESQVGRASDQPARTPELPRVFLDTSFVPAPGRVIHVAAGGNLQKILDEARAGDTIRIESGASFVGNFVLPRKDGDAWIVVRSDVPDDALPPPGSRITPAHAPRLAKILTPNSDPALTAADGAHHYRLVGLEISTRKELSRTLSLVTLGNNRAPSLESLPHHITIDRCYIHGNSESTVRRGITLNAASIAVIDSHISDIHEAGADSQAICGWNGPGPFKIVNNYLEGAGENIMFGGAQGSLNVDPHFVVPSDIEIRHNHFYKPLRWREGDPGYDGSKWTIKNLFELKNAQRVLIEGNIFEQCWAAAQRGFAFALTPRVQSGPRAVLQDVTFRLNIVRGAASGVAVSGADGEEHPPRPQRGQRILFENNLFEQIDGGRWGGQGRLFQPTNAVRDLQIVNNTAFQSGPVSFAEQGLPYLGFVFSNNIVPHGAGFAASGKSTGFPTLEAFFPDSVFTGNVLVAGPSYLFPKGNFFPNDWKRVGFVDLAGGNYRLSPKSPYKNKGRDGRDIGADIDAIEKATAGVVLATATQPK